MPHNYAPTLTFFTLGNSGTTGVQPGVLLQVCCYVYYIWLAFHISKRWHCTFQELVCSQGLAHQALQLCFTICNAPDLYTTLEISWPTWSHFTPAGWVGLDSPWYHVMSSISKWTCLTIARDSAPLLTMPWTLEHGLSCYSGILKSAKPSEETPEMFLWWDKGMSADDMSIHIISVLGSIMRHLYDCALITDSSVPLPERLSETTLLNLDR